MLTNDEQLTEVIIGAAMTVLNKLKLGLDEKLYERALVIELAKKGLVCDQQKQHSVFYDEKLILRSYPISSSTKPSSSIPRLLLPLTTPTSLKCLVTLTLPA
jgi:hypothetical protein